MEMNNLESTIMGVINSYKSLEKELRRQTEIVYNVVSIAGWFGQDNCEY